MILGDSFLADGARAAFGQVPFYWVLDHPKLLPLGHRLTRAPSGSLVVISTPILVGTIARLEAEFPQHTWAYIPENVRASHPEDWHTQARYIIGCRDPHSTRTLSSFFHPSITMSPESAEMTKHALNGFLAISCQYAQDIAHLATLHGADPDDVARGMMSDPRIGERAYLKPVGKPGPHLLREVDNLRSLGL